jgi:chromosomal replication initiator protein
VPLDGRFRFDNFVVGAANRLAAAAANAVAESPGAVYNPLFVYSSSGLGKTHLMGAIASHAIQVHGKLNDPRGPRRGAARGPRRQPDR